MDDKNKESGVVVKILHEALSINFEGPIKSQFDESHPHFIHMKFGDPPIKGCQNLVIPPLSC